MGIVRAVSAATRGTLAEQWLEVIQAKPMSAESIVTTGQWVRKNDKRSQNNKGTEGVISNGSVIHVEENQFMLLVDGGKVIDYTALPGYYTVSLSTAPSLFGGQFSGVVEDAFTRVKFGGTTPAAMVVYFINLQEIKNIPFGTSTPINYFDEFYNAELYLRMHGHYSIRVTNPLQFYSEMVARDAHDLTIEQLKKICLSEFLGGLQSAIGKLSVEGERISHVGAKNTELAKIMADLLDEDWSRRRGMLIESVGISNISYDDTSKEIIDIRNRGAVLTDSNIREGYARGAVARGIEAAGSNPAGGMQAMMGVGIGRMQGDAFVGAAASTSPGWLCPTCQIANNGNFCKNCGTGKPGPGQCSNCGTPAEPGAKFCSHCGNRYN